MKESNNSHQRYHSVFKPVVAGMLLLTLSACGGGQSGNAAQGQSGPPPKVDVKTLQPQKVEIKETDPGRVNAYRIAEVRPQINGIIQKRLFEEGSDVKQGDVLYRVDAAPYQAALASAKANQAVAEANKENACVKASRYSRLGRQSAISQQDTDDAATACKQGEAQVQAAKAAVASAQINLNYTRITAPISGVVDRSTVTEGALVSAQQASALTTIRQLSPIYVDIKRSPQAVLKSGGQATDAEEISLELEPGTPYPEKGVLKFSGNNVDETTGMLNARSEFANENHVLLPGMFVTATLVIKTIPDAILAPQQSIARTPDGSATALVVNDQNQVESRPVVVSQTIGDQWLVTSGLQAGDRVIYSGLQKIKPGATVEPLEKGKVAAEPSAGDKQSDSPQAASQKQE